MFISDEFFKIFSISVLTFNQTFTKFKNAGLRNHLNEQLDIVQIPIMSVALMWYLFKELYYDTSKVLLIFWKLPN